eukprot:TRINITY_DN1714_c0_g1_i1.p1 TRINITY_DN1714_c0_g1~~TRINITY_DN1714_c0_g1_i1.p1  ORF type:complete len:164 (+),score=18.16 TRINITY_DN1714_c0_g1_i1:179-670(+)
MCIRDSRNVVHRDLKPENILIGPGGELKISDFGLAACGPASTLLQTHCGSEKYAAPEVMGSSRPYVGRPADVWSVGVILYMMLSAEFPFEEASVYSDKYNSLLFGHFEFPEFVSKNAQDLLLKMFAVNSRRRITISNVYCHAWMTLSRTTLPDFILSDSDLNC